MSNELTNLKSADDLSDLAKILHFTPKGLAYVLYKMPADEKYSVFHIPKKSGGFRTIKSPIGRLRLLQSRLADLLYTCAKQLGAEEESTHFWRASHGFCRGKTIASNAEQHRRRRYVFNIDIEDFFGSINFGRVRGFFMHDRSFKLTPKVATLIAQIVCHENSLPQGSPCSPVVSNLIGNILDSKLLKLASRTRCTYTRYADDLTFSCNEQHFPVEIAENVIGSQWLVGTKLRKEIESSGFHVNNLKTRMSLRRSQQTVTGLVVNKKVNINQRYYRAVRAMRQGSLQYHRLQQNFTESFSGLFIFFPIRFQLS